MVEIIDIRLNGGSTRKESLPLRTSTTVSLSSDDIKNGGFQRVEANQRVIEEIATEIKADIFGQEAACDQIALAIVRAKAGLSDPQKPKSVIMFLGPSGVGKTESTKALAKHVFGSSWEDRFKRIDCSQLTQSQSITKLTGSDPSYVGYGDRNTYFNPEALEAGMVIGFDEIEKAHPDIWRWLLPVMDEGQSSAVVPIESHNTMVPRGELTTLNFRNSWLVFTSNAGAQEMHEAAYGIPVGFTPAIENPSMENIGQKELRKRFRTMPEFLDRFRSIVVFENLKIDAYLRIFDKYIERINQGSKTLLATTAELREFLVAEAVGTGDHGARKIGRVIDSELMSRASEILVSGTLNGQRMLIGDIDEGEIIFWTAAQNKLQ